MDGRMSALVEGHAQIGPLYAEIVPLQAQSDSR